MHLHCLIPGGALSADKQHWHPATSTHLFPVKVISRLYRGKMVSALRRAWRQQQLPHLTATALSAQLDALMRQDWVVYSRATLHRADTVVKYLSRYTYRIALSEQRLLGINAQQVCFRWHDYRDDQDKTLCLDGEAFIRRFLLHILPHGFMRIRHYGFMANRCRQACREKIAHCLETPTMEKTEEHTPLPSSTWVCPRCHTAKLRVGFDWPRPRLKEG